MPRLHDEVIFVDCDFVTLCCVFFFLWKCSLTLLFRTLKGFLIRLFVFVCLWRFAYDSFSGSLFVNITSTNSNSRYFPKVVISHSMCCFVFFSISHAHVFHTHRFVRISSESKEMCSACLPFRIYFLFSAVVFFLFVCLALASSLKVSHKCHHQPQENDCPRRRIFFCQFHHRVQRFVIPTNLRWFALRVVHFPHRLRRDNWLDRRWLHQYRTIHCLRWWLLRVHSERIC